MFRYQTEVGLWFLAFHTAKTIDMYSLRLLTVVDIPFFPFLFFLSSKKRKEKVKKNKLE